jgi:Na+/proline symporter
MAGPVRDALAAPAPTSWFAELEQWAIPICGSVVAQEVLSRTLAARSESIARKAAIYGGACYVAVGLIPLAIGALGPQMVPDLEDPEGVLAVLSRDLLPTALNLVFAGALIAAILSTVDSCLLVVASLVARNLAPRRAGPPPAGGRLGLARWSVVCGGLVAYALATSDYNVADLVEEASGFGSAGVFLLATLGLYSGLGEALAANLTLVTGLTVWVTGRHLAPDLVPHPYLTSLASAAAAFAVGCALERRTQRTSSAPAGDQ